MRGPSRVSSEEKFLVPLVHNSGESPTAPAHSIPTWIDMTQGDDQSTIPTQVQERDPYDAPSWVHMSREQDEAASMCRRISQTSDNQHREVAEVEVPHISCGGRRLVLVPQEVEEHPCRSKTGSIQMKKREGKRPKFKCPFLNSRVSWFGRFRH